MIMLDETAPIGVRGGARKRRHVSQGRARLPRAGGEQDGDAQRERDGDRDECPDNHDGRGTFRAGPAANRFAVANTDASIGGVSRPVCVFCRLG